MNSSRKNRFILKCETVLKYVEFTTDNPVLEHHLVEGFSLFDYKYKDKPIESCCTIINPPRFFILEPTITESSHTIQTLLLIDGNYLSVETETLPDLLDTQVIGFKKGFIRPETESYFNSHFKTFSEKSNLFRLHIEKSSEISKLREMRTKFLDKYKTKLSSFIEE